MFGLDGTLGRFLRATRLFATGLFDGVAATASRDLWNENL